MSGRVSFDLVSGAGFDGGGVRNRLLGGVGETGRRYLSDGTIQFTNTTKQTVPYTATIESG